jgi:branched-chain amino acid aminotransferase
METIVYYNGNFVRASEAHVSIFDHGFLYGDGVFETIRVYDGMPFAFEEHMDRLFRSADGIALKIPLIRSVILKATEVLLEKNNLTDAMIRICITRGEGDVGLDTDLCPNPTFLIIPRQWAPYPRKHHEKGVKIHLSSVVRMPSFTIPATVKSHNYLSNILAKEEAKREGCFDAIMLNLEGYVAEGPTSNIFLVKDGQLQTPALTSGILQGVTRTTIMRLAEKKGIEVYERMILPEEISQADECFLTNTSMEVMPVTACGADTIGRGMPGAITLALRKAFRQHLDELLRVYKTRQVLEEV